MARRQELGKLGENIAANMLSMNYDVVLHEHGYDGDITARDSHGILTKVEVKVSTMQSNGKWQFRIKCKGHCDHRKSDVLLLLAKYGRRFIVFVVPVQDVRDISIITISSHPLSYAGKYAKYKQDLSNISLELGE